jgi:hypothetical protein
MAEEITTSEVVKNVSNGTVQIAVERYEQLLAKASEEKRPVYPTYTTVEKTPAMQAADNMMWGSMLMGGGVFTTVVGGIVFVIGLKQKKAL